MNRRSLLIIFSVALLAVAAAGANAQLVASVDKRAGVADTIARPEPAAEPQQLEPSFDVQLQLLIGTNDASAPRGDIPANLSNLSKQLKTNMPFSNYRLASTFFGRLGTDGNFEYKSTSNIFGQENDARMLTFLEWSVVRLKNLPTPKGGQGFRADTFRFGAKVPVVTAQAVSYEPIGLNLARIGIVENTPTLLGTLNLPGANGTLFLVITIKTVDM